MSTHIDLPSTYTPRRKIAVLYSYGYEPEAIANILDISLPSVKNHIDKLAASAIDDQRANTIREAELAKLDAIEQAYMDRAVQPEVFDEDGQIIAAPSTVAADMVLKVMDRRSKLAGLEKREAQSVTNNNITLVGVLSSMSSDDMTIIPKAKVIENDERSD